MTTIGASDGAARSRVLDGIRGLAILLVIQFHFWGLAFGLTGRPAPAGLDREVKRLFGVGWVGVDLFFVLSGFLITGILLDAKRGGRYFSSFYGRRFLRIFPLYWGYLLAVVLIAPLIGGALEQQARPQNVADNWFWYFGYLVNVWSAVKPLNNDLAFVNQHFWSLAVEEQFYLIWPALVLLLTRRALLRLCVALLIGSVVFRYYLVSGAADAWANGNAAHVLLPAHLDPIVLGAVLAVAVRDEGTLLDRLWRWVPAAAAVSAATLVFLYVTRGGLSTLDAQVVVVGLLAIAVLFACLLLATIRAPAGSLLHRVFAGEPLCFLGRYSYAIYVYHVLIALLLISRTTGPSFAREVGGSQIPMSIVFSAVATAVTASAAWLSWHLYEQHFLKLKRYLPYGGRAGAFAPAAAGRTGAEEATAVLTT